MGEERIGELEACAGEQGVVGKGPTCVQGRNERFDAARRGVDVLKTALDSVDGCKWSVGVR